jgi:hypothetical protein
MFLISALLIVVAVSVLADAQKKTKGTLIVPAWKIQIVDQAGKPVRNVLVRQACQDYDIEDNGHEADARSDENGYVTFPERREPHVSKLVRTKNRLKNMRELGVHASYGVYAYVMAWGQIVGCKMLEGNVDYERGKPLPTKLQMHVSTLPGLKCNPLIEINVF